MLFDIEDIGNQMCLSLLGKYLGDEAIGLEGWNIPENYSFLKQGRLQGKFEQIKTWELIYLKWGLAPIRLELVKPPQVTF